MNQEFKEEWCQALESGKYEQGKGFLCSNGKFCCLGVAEDLLSKKGVVKASEEEGGIRYTDISKEGDTSMYLLTPDSFKYMGLPDYSPNVVTNILDPNNEPTVYALSTINDFGVGFKTIAKLIREQL